MDAHSELLLWKKCSTCGYSEIDEQARKAYPNISLYTPRDPGTVAAKAIEERDQHGSVGPSDYSSASGKE